MPDPLILAYDALKDPRDLAEVIHLAAGLGAEVHLIGKSLDPRHWKVLRKLRSWRPGLAERPGEIDEAVKGRFGGVAQWAAAVRARGFQIAATVVEGGERPWHRTAPGRIAVLFGEEAAGLGPEAVALCDRRWTIPLGSGGKFYTLGQATAVLLGGWLEGRCCGSP